MLNNGSGGYMSDSQWYPLKLYLAGKVFDSDNFLLFFLSKNAEVIFKMKIMSISHAFLMKERF